MPLYTYHCERCGRVFDQRAGFDDSTFKCECGGEGKRQSVYSEQGVIFAGEGWTKGTIAPPAPTPPITKGEKGDIAFEKLDEFASKSYEHDKEVRANQRSD